MKRTLGRRGLALVLTLALCLALAPAVFADDPPALTGISVALDQTVLNLAENGTASLKATVTAKPETADTTGLTYEWKVGDGSIAEVTPTDQATVTVKGLTKGKTNITVTSKCGTVTSNEATCAVTVEELIEEVTLSPNNNVTLEPGLSRQVTATTKPAGQGSITWASSNSSVATVTTQGVVWAKSPGKTEITATATGAAGGNTKTSPSLTVEVSGIKLASSTLRLRENESVEAPLVELFGAAAGKNVNWMSMNPDIAEYSGGHITGRGPGRTTIKATVGGGVYEATLTVDVDVDPNSTIDRTSPSLKITDTLKFDGLVSSFQGQAGRKLSYITGLRVDTTQGTLYYKYYSEAEPGAGVAQDERYYIAPRSGQKDLREITFVPKPNFSGGAVTINYTAVSDTYENYQCRILLTVEPKGSASAVALSTAYDTPVKLNGAEFERICQELNGASLSSVTFTQPSSRQGTLYTDYISAGNYGSVVSTGRAYTRQELDNIWFVPAPGFEGTVSISYTARGRNSSGSAYTGSLTIAVGERNDVNSGGPAYFTANGGPVTFDDRDFEDYRAKVLPGGGTLSYIQFGSLPSAAQGALYYDYRTISSPGSRVSAGTSYYYGTRTPRLDRITFVPAEGFTGVVRIPFTGWDRDGRRFSGEVEVAVRGSGGSGDIRYTCSPGRSVSFLNSDFTSLCQELTDRSLNYIMLQDLPDRYSEGSLYHNTSSRVSSTGTRYYANSSNSYRISRLSFKAVSGFFGSVDIPFVGYATNGDSFNGTVTIDSNGVTDWTIRYTGTTGSPAKFLRDDFDSLSQWDSREDVSSVRFSVPSTSQGDLYRNYYSTSSKGTRISSSSTSISAGSLNQVAFVPNKSFTGTVYIDFTATTRSGGTFTGVVEVAVEREAADATARYYTQSAPVKFDSQDLRQGTRTLSYVRFSQMPASGEGRLYYRYTSPLRQEREADTKTNYRVSGSSYSLISDLTFVPRAGYTGTVVLPYTGTNSNGSTFEGEVVITVSPTRSSAYFNDMGSYTDAQRAAVDFCRENNITRGISSTQFGPESSIRRGDFALMLYQAMELNPRYNGASFQDVADGAYYAQAVNTLRVLGVVSGVGGGRYDPDGTLSRQDAVCMVQRAMQTLNMGGYDGSASYLNGYTDSDRVAGYARGAMAFAVREGYLPTGNSRLDAYQPLSRVDMAQMLHRVLTY